MPNPLRLLGEAEIPRLSLQHAGQQDRPDLCTACHPLSVPAGSALAQIHVAHSYRCTQKWGCCNPMFRPRWPEWWCLSYRYPSPASPPTVEGIQGAKAVHLRAINRRRKSTDRCTTSAKLQDCSRGRCRTVRGVYPPEPTTGTSCRQAETGQAVDRPLHALLDLATQSQSA